MGEKRKVLLATLDVIPDVTGASTRLTEILRGLTPVFEVDVLTPKTEAHAHIERYYGARLMRVPMLRRDLPSRAQTLERAVRRQLESDEYELVHVTDPFGGYPVCQRKGQSSHRVVYDAYELQSLTLPLTSPELDDELRFRTRLGRVERHCLLNADIVLASSLAFQARLLGLGVSEDRIRIVPPPVDLTRYREAPLPEAGPLRLAYVGACAAWEATDTVLKALRLLLDRGVPAKLSIAGHLDAAAQQRVQAARDELKLGEAIELLGLIPHELIHEILEHADVCLAPFAAPPNVGAVGLGSLKLVEYLAAGRPVVAADSPLYRELAGDPPAAVFFGPGDASQLADRLQDLAKDQPQRAQLAERARARARSGFDAGLARKAVLRAYYDLLDPSAAVSDQVAAAPDHPAARGGGASADSESSTAEVAIPEAATNPAGREPSTAIFSGPPPSSETTPVVAEPTPIAPMPGPPASAPVVAEPPPIATAPAPPASATVVVEPPPVVAAPPASEPTPAVAAQIAEAPSPAIAEPTPIVPEPAAAAAPPPPEPPAPSFTPPPEDWFSAHLPHDEAS